MADETQWPDATINAWISDAIRDYSVFFSRRLTATINCVTDQVEYSLSSLTHPRSIVSVEYPDGEDPMVFLARRPKGGCKRLLGRVILRRVGRPCAGDVGVRLEADDW